MSRFFSLYCVDWIQISEGGKFIHILLLQECLSFSVFLFFGQEVERVKWDVPINVTVV